MPGSGSETRQRQRPLKARFTDAEAALIEAQADAAGVSVAALIRYAVLGLSPPRASRKPAVKLQEVARLIGQLGALKSALMETAARGTPDECARTVDAACRDIADICHAAFKALGREP